MTTLGFAMNNTQQQPLSLSEIPEGNEDEVSPLKASTQQSPTAVMDEKKEEIDESSSTTQSNNVPQSEDAVSFSTPTKKLSMGLSLSEVSDDDDSNLHNNHLPDSPAASTSSHNTSSSNTSTGSGSSSRLGSRLMGRRKSKPWAVDHRMLRGSDKKKDVGGGSSSTRRTRSSWKEQMQERKAVFGNVAVPEQQDLVDTSALSADDDYPDESLEISAAAESPASSKKSTQKEPIETMEDLTRNIQRAISGAPADDDEPDDVASASSSDDEDHPIVFLGAVSEDDLQEKEAKEGEKDQQAEVKEESPETESPKETGPDLVEDQEATAATADENTKEAENTAADETPAETSTIADEAPAETSTLAADDSAVLDDTREEVDSYSDESLPPPPQPETTKDEESPSSPTEDKVPEEAEESLAKQHESAPSGVATTEPPADIVIAESAEGGLGWVESLGCFCGDVNRTGSGESIQEGASKSQDTDDNIVETVAAPSDDDKEEPAAEPKESTVEDNPPDAPEEAETDKTAAEETASVDPVAQEKEEEEIVATQSDEPETADMDTAGDKEPTEKLAEAIAESKPKENTDEPPSTIEHDEPPSKSISLQYSVSTAATTDTDDVTKEIPPMAATSSLSLQYSASTTADSVGVADETLTASTTDAANEEKAKPTNEKAVITKRKSLIIEEMEGKLHEFRTSNRFSIESMGKGGDSDNDLQLTKSASSEGSTKAAAVMNEMNDTVKIMYTGHHRIVVAAAAPTKEAEKEETIDKEIPGAVASEATEPAETTTPEAEDSATREKLEETTTPSQDVEVDVVGSEDVHETLAMVLSDDQEEQEQQAAATDKNDEKQTKMEQARPNAIDTSVEATKSAAAAVVDEASAPISLPEAASVDASLSTPVGGGKQVMESLESPMESPSSARRSSIGGKAKKWKDRLGAKRSKEKTKAAKDETPQATPTAEEPAAVAATSTPTEASSKKSSKVSKWKDRLARRGSERKSLEKALTPESVAKAVLTPETAKIVASEDVTAMKVPSIIQAEIIHEEVAPLPTVEVPAPTPVTPTAVTQEEATPTPNATTPERDPTETQPQVVDKAKEVAPVVETPKAEEATPVVETPKVETAAPVVEKPKAETAAPVTEKLKTETAAPVVEKRNAETANKTRESFTGNQLMNSFAAFEAKLGERQRAMNKQFEHAELNRVPSDDQTEWTEVTIQDTVVAKPENDVETPSPAVIPPATSPSIPQQNPIRTSTIGIGSMQRGLIAPPSPVMPTLQKFPTINLDQPADDEMTQLTFDHMTTDEYAANEEDGRTSPTPPGSPVAPLMDRRSSTSVASQKTGKVSATDASETSRTSDAGLSRVSEGSNERIVDILRKELFNPHHKAVQAAVESLGREADNGSRTRACIVRYGGLLAVLQILVRFMAKSGVVTACCRTLEKLAVDPLNQVALGEMGCIKDVVTAMSVHKSKTKVQQAACALLYSISRCCQVGNDKKHYEAIPTGMVVSALCLCMAKYSKDGDIQMNGFGALANFCIDNEERLKELSKAGGITSMTMALQKPWKSKSRKHEAISSLSMLLRGLAEQEETDVEDNESDDGDDDTTVATVDVPKTHTGIASTFDESLDDLPSFEDARQGGDDSVSLCDSLGFEKQPVSAPRKTTTAPMPFQNEALMAPAFQDEGLMAPAFQDEGLMAPAFQDEGLMAPAVEESANSDDSNDDEETKKKEECVIM